jgi:transposase
MRPKTYPIELSSSEREWLQSVVRGAEAPSKRERARILLKADENRGDGGWNDRQIAEALEVSLRSVQRVRARVAAKGLRATIEGDYHQRPHVRKIDGPVEARLIALCCGPAPQGRSRWTLKLLADKLVELELLDSIDPSAIYHCLKKMNLNPGVKNSGASPRAKTRPSSAPWKRSSKFTSGRGILPGP